MLSAASHALRGNKLVVEGTSGSTGISLAHLCRSLGLQLHVFLPDDQAEEKRVLLEKLGAVVTIQKCCSISNREHYVNAAKRFALESDGVMIDQFDNLANYEVHYKTTGPEIWKQTEGTIDCFVMSAGTGGTIAGVSAFLKEKRESIQVVLADPPGSSLFNRIKHGVCFTNEQKESKMKRHRYDTIVEGIGLDRVTKNFELALIDSAVRVEDQESLDLAHWILENEGLFIGSSSAVNLVALCRVARTFPPCSTLVTIVCDSGRTHMSRFWNEAYVKDVYSLNWPTRNGQPSCLSGLNEER
jgi:cysteine synthase